MECKEARPLMHEYLDGDLAGSDAARLKEHLLGCSACKLAFQQLENTEALVRSLPRERAGDDMVDRIMQSLPKPNRSRRWVQWVRRHPAVSAASVFLLVMLGSFVSMWGQDREMIVKGADLDQVEIHGDTVYVPAGHKVNGNLMVERGKIEVAGEVTGNLVVVDGSYDLASTAKISGQIREVDRAVDWLWFKFGELVGSVSP